MRIRTLTGGLVAGLVLIVLQVTPAAAAAGDLDTSFSSNGKVKLDASFDGQDVALQSDGKIVAIGSDGERMVVFRLNRDGSLDDTFSDDGILRVRFGQAEGTFSEAEGVALVNGDIVVVGTKFAGSITDISLAVARINTDGTLDDTFSSDGKQTFRLSSDTRGAGVAIQANGRIVCVGSDGDDLLVVRFKADGTPDTTFDGDGSVTTSFTEDVEGMAVAIDPATQRIVAGAQKSPTGHTEDFVIARYTTTGTLDSSWSDDGKRTTSTTTDGGLQSLTVLDNSRVIAVGYTESDTSGWQILVRKFESDGDYDDSWNDDGSIRVGFRRDGAPADDFGFDVDVQTDGKVVVAGTSLDGDREFAVLRLTTSGHLDDTFGGDGGVLTAFNEQAGANGVVINNGTGKIVVVGNAITNSLNSDGMYLARYLGS